MINVIHAVIDFLWWQNLSYLIDLSCIQLILSLKLYLSDTFWFYKLKPEINWDFYSLFWTPVGVICCSLDFESIGSFVVAITGKCWCGKSSTVFCSQLMELDCYFLPYKNKFKTNNDSWIFRPEVFVRHGPKWYV